ncbi:uncharacterized protein LOC119735784 [Patiria miniata]|uniref:Uncharacterized protein n=1 Tax=Patiria miniata TaxID=46514 RepID=A0A914APU0_PATMI|nr:uncharacterized protein LOC119735784 [Patiria miniata]
MAEGGHELDEDLTEVQLAVVSVRYDCGTSVRGEFSQDSKGTVPAEDGNDDLGDVVEKTFEGSSDNTMDELDLDDCVEDGGEDECGVDEEEKDYVDDGYNEDFIEINTFQNDEVKLKRDNAERVKKRTKKKKHRSERGAQNQFLSSIAMHSDTAPQVVQLEVSRPCPVPSLVELCLQKGVRRVVVSDLTQPCQIAPGIRALLKAHNNQYKLEQVQLKWVLEALKHAEVYVKHHTLQFMNKHGKKSEFFVRDCRSLCSCDADVRVDAWELNDETKSNACIAVFAAGYDYSDWPIIALAHCINILLPTYLSEDGTNNTKTSIIRVKRFLNKHSSTLVTHCFNTALAYVWWCRGKVDKAKRALLDISDHIPSGNEVRLQPEPKKNFRSHTLFDQQKALCHNEIGRMFSQFDDPDAAVQFFRHAVEVINEGSSVARDRLVLQSCALSAAAYDQGQMDQSHANKAAAFWDHVTDDPICDEGLLQAAVESFIRCHAGFSVCETNASLPLGGKYESWLWEANSRIKKAVGKGPQLYLHQSLVLAMLGENKLAEKAYQDYVEQYVHKTDIFIDQDAGPMPGSGACAASSTLKYQPWWVLLEWMATKANLDDSRFPRPIQMLPIIWRRILRHESYTECVEKNVCEVQGQPLNLHLTHDGYLTGAFMHNLPPWKAVLLNPYTGNICVPDQHRQHELQEWGKEELCAPCSEFGLNYSIPIPILLYHDAANETVVTLMNVASNANFRQKLIAFNVGDGTCPRIANIASTLIYSKGRVTVKLNLRQLVLEARRKNILQQVKDLTPSVDINALQDVVDVLDFCCRRGLQINFALAKEMIGGKKKEFMETVQQQMGVKVNGGTSKVKGGPKKESANSGQTPRHQALQLQKILYVGESTVVLCLYTGANPPEAEHDCPLNQDTLVFLDCSSPEAFRNPVIHCPHLPHLEWELPAQHNCWTSKLCKQNVIFFYANSEAIVIFDEFGSIIHKEKIHRCRYNYRACSGCTLLGCEPGLRPEQTSLRVLDAKSMQKLSEPLKEVDDFIVEQNMVFVSRLSNVFVLDPVSLKPLVVQKPTKTGVTPEARSDGILIQGEARSLRVLATDIFSKPSPTNCNQRIACTRLILGVANHVLILERQRSVNNLPGDASFPIEVVVDIIVPGVPTEALYISHGVGFVVSASIFDTNYNPFHRENLYWFDRAGVIMGIHPMIGEGPHSFTAIPLYTDREKACKMDAAGVMVRRERRWHLFFADGFGALCCIRFDVEDPALF